MKWKELIKIIQDRGMEDEEFSAHLEIRAEDGAQDVNGSIFSYLELSHYGHLTCVVDDLKLDEEGCQMHTRDLPEAYENTRTAVDPGGVFAITFIKNHPDGEY